MKQLIQYSILIFSFIISVNGYADFYVNNQTNAQIEVETVCNSYHHRAWIDAGKGANIVFSPQYCEAGTLKYGKIGYTDQYAWVDLEAKFKDYCPNFKGNGPVNMTGSCDEDPIFGYCLSGSIRMSCPNN